MVQIDITYQGDLRCQAKHGPSGTILDTDAPVDNMGRGQSFSPTDLVATALGTCMLTTMGIAAKRIGVDLNGTTASVAKEMSAAPPRRVVRLPAAISSPAKVSDEERRTLEHAALNCPVMRSLHPEIQAPVTFAWDQAK